MINEYMEAVTEARNMEELWAMHTAKMAGFGFDRLIYGFTRYLTPTSLGNPQDMIILSNHETDYLEHFISEGLYFNAPMVNWSRDNEGAAGYTISLKAISARSKAAIALTAKKVVSQYEIDQVWAEHGRDSILMNNVAQLKIISLPHHGRRSLTKRQVEVLEWVGDGKTTQDFATLMGLTSATVEKHLRLAREALDVETTAQAVTKAAFQNQMYIVEPTT